MILTGIHISSYGLDFEDRIQLIELVEKVAAIEGVKRLRISSLEPRIITEEFVERLAKTRLTSVRIFIFPYKADPITP